MLKFITPIIFLMTGLINLTKGQIVYDNFSDLEISTKPKWYGDIGHFEVNADAILQLKFKEESLRPVQLTTPIEFNNDSLEWRFDVNLDFNPSQNNRVELYLMCNTDHLFRNDSIGYEAYYLRIGENGNEDKAMLYYEAGGVQTLIAEGGAGLFANDFYYKLRVRKIGSIWTVSMANKDSENFQPLMTGHDNNNLGSEGFLGLACHFSESRSDRFYFDNIYFGEFIYDTIPPEIVDYFILNEKQLSLSFSEKVEDNFNLSFNPSLKIDSIVYYDDSIQINVETGFQNGVNYNLELLQLEDTSGNMVDSLSFSFLYYKTEPASAGDIIINEFLADPTPILGLAESEYVELYNRSEKFIDLNGWSISDNSNTKGEISSYILHPNSYVILTNISAEESYQNYGDIIKPTSWKSLNNSGDSIILKNKHNVVIDHLNYDKSWYKDEEKSEGGYALERINPLLNCFDIENWKASINETGGTPGRVNSIFDSLKTGENPTIEEVSIKDSTSVNITFNKTIGEANLRSAHYVFTNEIAVDSINPLSDNKVELQLNNTFINGNNYQLSILNLNDCNGNISEEINYPFTFDLLAPKVISVDYLADSIVRIGFNEPINMESARLKTNYYLNPEVPLDEIVVVDSQKIVLVFKNNLIRSFPYQLYLSGIKDGYGNSISREELSLIPHSDNYAGFNELLITEIMAAPREDQSLPNSEYFEIFNLTDRHISLANVYFKDKQATTSLGIRMIGPNEYMIFTPASAVEEFHNYGQRSQLTPWLNLNNAGDELQLFRPGKIIHQVNYSDLWYKDFEKENGGWSLEMIDINNPCGGINNWMASTATEGGTPGQANAVATSNPDLQPIKIERVIAIDSQQVLITLNEPFNQPELRKSHFEIIPERQIKDIQIIDYRKIKIELKEALQTRRKYKVRLKNLTDCVGNVALDDIETNFALTEKASPGEIILNEVLFNPRVGGVDFIELMNISEKYINLSNWKINTITQSETIFENDNIVIEPGAIIALTENKETLLNHYPTPSSAKHIYTTELPNFKNEEDSIKISNSEFELQMASYYHEDFHLVFLNEIEGVSLERISPLSPHNNPNFWRSAASTVGFATPGNENSNQVIPPENEGQIRVSPKTFAPHAPNRNFTMIKYELSTSNSVANIKIFDMNGMLVKTIANNETLAQEGAFRWDGEDNNGRKLGTGYYLINFKLFTNDGNVRELNEKVAIGF